jgi:hypothetical protein
MHAHTQNHIHTCTDVHKHTVTDNITCMHTHKTTPHLHTDVHKHHCVTDKITYVHTCTKYMHTRTYVHKHTVSQVTARLLIHDMGLNPDVICAVPMYTPITVEGYVYAFPN